MKLALKKTRLSCGVWVAIGLASTSLSLFAEETYELPGVTVEGEETAASGTYRLDGEEVLIGSSDAAELLRRTPGGNVNRNGPLSGIAQYRGMYGDRVNVLVDGIYINSGGPNAMDPPLHYVARPLLDSLEVVRGISPVSAGAETIGGTIRVQSKTSEFNNSDTFEATIDANAVVTSNKRGSALGALWSVARRDHRFHASGTTEYGSHTEAGGGDTIFPTRYRRDSFGAGYGFRLGAHELALDLQRNETGETGTPALPMDIVYVDSTFGGAEYFGDWADFSLHAQLFASDVEHKMANFTLREPPLNPLGMVTRRFAITSSSGTGWRFDSGLPLGFGRLSMGFDGHAAEHDATVFDPDNPMFFVDTYNEVERKLYGLFAEWNSPLGTAWNLQLGGRLNSIESDAGFVDSSLTMAPNPALQQAVTNLRDEFNASDRKRSDTNYDLVAQLRYRINPIAAAHLGLARKTRSPSYQERYLWLPLESTGGLADGNVYIGDVYLDPEVSNQFELGLDLTTSRAYLTPRFFYHLVDDYIQGVPTDNEDATTVAQITQGDDFVLQFSNVDARLYGFDMDWGFRIDEHWRLDGIVNYVRGKRRDIADNLYRIAPLNATVALTYEQTKWSGTAEVVAYDSQNSVSATNREEKTPGYGLLNLFGHYSIVATTVLRAGVYNVFDKRYQEHLNGYNRVRDSDIPLGERLPGAGRNFFLQLAHRFE